MVDVIDLPVTLTITNRTDPHLMQNTRSGGEALDGGEQVLSPLSSRWTWGITIPVLNKSMARAMRVFRTTAKGKFNYLRIPICDQYRINRRDVGIFGVNPNPFSDQSYFSDGSGFGLPQPTSSVAADAEESSEFVSIVASPIGDAMTAGVFISINDWLYHIDNWEADGGNFILQISPPLREPVTTSDDVLFSAVALWVMDSDSAARLDLNIGRFGMVNINLIEPVGRRLNAS